MEQEEDSELHTITMDGDGVIIEILEIQFVELENTAIVTDKSRKG